MLAPGGLESPAGVCKKAAMAPHRWPLPLRVTLYAIAFAILLYLTQAPSHDLPRVDVWDKAEHAGAWFALAGLGFVLFPFWPELIGLLVFGFGGLVELLQWLLPFGRDPSLWDWAADTVGVVAALVAYGLLRRLWM
jgi:VanZ family protein